VRHRCGTIVRVIGVGVIGVGICGLVGACGLQDPQRTVGSDMRGSVALTEVSQAPYRYDHATYWTLANGCTYSPAPGLRGGWRWFLVANPLSSRRSIARSDCTIILEEVR